ncbi:MAG: type VI secretion system tip protein VgrG [Sandaracinaceae bacterium]|nr:type VI secretion system tip protein VgrG [Sandaracinaceae bacterium]
MTGAYHAVFSIEGQESPPVVLAVRGFERLGHPFDYEVVFRCAGVMLEDARGSLANLELEDGRYVSGIVDSLRAEVVGVAQAHQLPKFTARLRPQPYTRLVHRRGFRIWQELNVVDLVKAVFTEAGVADDQVDWAGVTGSYPVRTFTVQYDETEWDFVCRLLEEEGIYFAFTHDAAGHVMVMLDANASAVAAEPASLPFLPSDALALEQDGVWRWTERAVIREAKVTLRDFDLERPSLDLTSEVSTAEVIEREHYAYPGYYTEPSEGARLAQVRLDAFRSMHHTASGKTNALTLLPGQRFELTDHDDFAGDYLVTQIRLDVVADEPGPEGTRFELDLEVQPLAQEFRSPRRTPKPKVLGVQTAMVAGPSGEEIHVDALGRVKVQFHWDRQGTGDEHASCWMRVTQAHTTGSIMIPRIGWEVLVEFVDGDPDRPIVLGRLWNPNTTPPHELPGCKTYTCHASVSSPGGGGTNELVMDDTAGSEKITINAQHDYDLVVANDRMLNVGTNLATTVEGSRTASVGANEERAIKGEQGDNVTGTHAITVGAMREVKVTGKAVETVTGAMSFSAGSEMVQVGSPAAAILQVITDAAIGAAVGAAANAASRAQAALMGPIAPALGAARGAIGTAAQFAGPAQALLGSPNPNIAAVSQAAGSLSNVAGAADAGSIAAGLAQSALSSAIGDQLRAAAGGGGGGGGNGGPTGPSGATSGGSGQWGLTVEAAVSESVGGVAAWNSASGIATVIGGSNRETVGGARVELVKGGKSETVGAAKAETVGVYVAKAKKSYGVSAKAAIALNIAGPQSNKISGGHSIAAQGPVVVTAPTVSLKASGKITLACGACKVIIEGGGVNIEGASEVTIEGSTIKLPETSLGT